MPKVIVSYEFDSAEEAAEFLATNPTDADDAGDAGDAGEPETPKRGRGRPAGSTKKKPASKKKAAASSSDDISDETLRLELNKIVEHKDGGAPMAKKFLGKHTKVSDVPQDERQKIVDAVAKKLEELNGSDESDDDFLD